MTARRYLITGATGGLGSAVVSALRERGDKVDAMKRTSFELSDNPEHAEVAVLEFAQGGSYDGIVHCAGVDVVAPLRTTSQKQYRAAMMAAGSAFGILRAAARKGTMADGGSIVLMSSVAAHRGTAGMAAYSAGKAAIEAMARCAALELAPRGIRVNCVAAGAFVSPMHERITEGMTEDGVRAYAAKHPLGFGTADKVRDAVLWLLGDQTRWVTGTTLTVDGGLAA